MMRDALNLGEQKNKPADPAAQKELVEQGRLKKTQQDLEKALEEIAALKAQLANVSTTSIKQRISEGMKPSDLVDGEVDERLLDYSAKSVSLAQESVKNELSPEIEALREKIKKLEQGQGQAMARAVDQQIAAVYPAFLSSIASDGEHEAKWLTFIAQPHQGSNVARGDFIKQAYNSGNTNSVFYFIDLFLKETGLLSQSQKLGGAIQPSSSSGTNENPQEVKVYTQAELDKMVKDAATDCNKGIITQRQKSEILAKVEKAINEGRVAG